MMSQFSSKISKDLIVPILKVAKQDEFAEKHNDAPLNPKMGKVYSKMPTNGDDHLLNQHLGQVYIDREDFDGLSKAHQNVIRTILLSANGWSPNEWIFGISSLIVANVFPGLVGKTDLQVYILANLVVVAILSFTVARENGHRKEKLGFITLFMACEAPTNPPAAGTQQARKPDVESQEDDGQNKKRSPV